MKIGFLQDESGDNSSKRLFTMILMCLWVVYFFSNLYWGKELKNTLEEYLFYMIVIAYGGVALEGMKDVFKRSGKPESKTESSVKTTETVKEITKTDA